MRCFFMREGRIESVQFLTTQSDADRIAEAKTLFETKGRPNGVDGFEVWDRDRILYRFPEPPKP
jgi:hypothetical protein